MGKEVGVSTTQIRKHSQFFKTVKTGNGSLMVDDDPLNVIAVICENSVKPGKLGKKFRAAALKHIQVDPQRAVDVCRKYPKLGELTYQWREKEASPKAESVVPQQETKLKVKDSGANVDLQNIRYPFMGVNIKYQGSQFLTSEFFLIALLEYAGIEPKRIVRDQQNNSQYSFAVYDLSERTKKILNGFITDARFEFNILAFGKAYRAGKKRLNSLY